MNDTKDIKSSPISSLKSEVAFNLENKNVSKVHIIGEQFNSLFAIIQSTYQSFEGIWVFGFHHLRW